MIRNLLVFLMMIAAAAAGAAAQVPEPNGRGAARAFAFAFPDDGGYLGVETQEITKENFSKFGLRDVRGVAVEKVIEGSPAASGGLQNGDVIVRFNGEEVTSVRKLTRLIGDVAPDHQAKVTVLRGGSEREVTVTMGKRPMPKFEEGNFELGRPGALISPRDVPDLMTLPPDGGRFGMLREFRERRQIGVNITPLTKQLAAHFGVAGGVLITTVHPDSPAAKAGLKAGDIITAVDGKDVAGETDIVRLIGEKKEGEVELTINRAGNRQTVRVTPQPMKEDYRRIEIPSSYFERDDAPSPSYRGPVSFPRGFLLSPFARRL